uniref:Glycerol kinase 5 n=1 Tax=Myripristis murdjan TaxID=586833 RepID=A0A667ZWB3_9TELE
MGSHRNGLSKERFILSVDVGTTSIRCHVYDKEAKIKGSCATKVVSLYPEPGLVEMDPEALWQGFVIVVKGAVQDAGIHMRQVEALGISTQRSTFTTWDRKTGVPFHNFISWQDLRAAELVKSWNRSCTMKVSLKLPNISLLSFIQKRFLAASLLVFSTQHVTFRLLWAITHYKQVEAVAEGNCCFGTVDTWLLYKLTKGGCGFFHVAHHFGSTDPSIFGVSIPIMSVMADQQAAMFGQCCFDTGDVKITMGTGTFMDINTGSKPHTSVAGLYPLVGWKIGSEVVYLAEGNAADTGTAINWAQELELFSDVQQTSAMAYSVPDSDGVCFVPSFSGLQAPLNDPKACASFMGLRPSNTKCHLVRAILESVAFRNKQLYETMLRETNIPINKIRVDGGVCTNDFVMQLTADLFGRKISRPQYCEMSCLGAAFVAGLGAGFWRSQEDLKKLQTTDKVFMPRGAAQPGRAAGHLNGEYIPVLQSWERAIRRSMNWYSKP